MILNLPKLFDWTIEDVRGPFTDSFYYANDGGVKLLGYKVIVDYKYHGREELFFDIDQDKLGLMNAELAQGRAYKCYINKRKKMNNQKNNQATVLEKIKNMFDWTIKSVGPITGIVGTEWDGRTNVIGYKVVVEYNHHNPRSYKFMRDDETVFTQYGGSARRAAAECYMQLFDQMKRQRAAQAR